MDQFGFVLQNTLIQYYKSGNIVIDLIISTIVVIFVQKIMHRVMNGTFEINLNFLNIFRKKVKSEYIIEGKVRQTAESFGIFDTPYIPKEFKAIMYIASKSDCDIKSVKQYDRKNNSSAKHFSYVINDSCNIQLDKDVWMRQENKSEKSSDIKIEIDTYIIKIFSYTLSMNELINKIYGWLIDYETYLSEQKDNNLYYYTYFGSTGTLPHCELIYDKTVFNTNKSFDNIFFDKKDSLLTRLDTFINHPDKYMRLGTPYTLGFLFYGEPGCGKTSTIKAIAKYTNRHIISVPLSRVTTCTELSKIFMDAHLIDRTVPINKRIFVFEDIDCMSHIVSDRDINNLNQNSVNNNSDENKNNNSVIVCLSDTSKIDQNKQDQKKDKLTLSFILNLIDGILEQPGRIIIFTTNKPEILDKALVRPGRVDMKINFTKCSTKCCIDIIKFFFEINENIITNKLVRHDLDNKYTPADIFEICYNENSLDAVIDKIIK